MATLFELVPRPGLTSDESIALKMHITIRTFVWPRSLLFRFLLARWLVFIFGLRRISRTSSTDVYFELHPSSGPAVGPHTCCF